MRSDSAFLERPDGRSPIADLLRSSFSTGAPKTLVLLDFGLDDPATWQISPLKRACSLRTQDRGILLGWLRL